MTLLSFRVRAVDGEAIPVPELEIGARFTYAEEHATTWSKAMTDGDGYALFRDSHPASPSSVCLYVDDEPCLTCEVGDGDLVVLEM